MLSILKGKVPDYVVTEISITNAKIKVLKRVIYEWLEWKKRNTNNWWTSFWNLTW